MGYIHRHAEAVSAYHDFEEENVVIVQTSHSVLGAASYQTTPLSIEAAAKLHQQLGEALDIKRPGFPPAHNCSMLRSRLEERLTALESRLDRTLEVNNLWDGS
ncbi:hypothetical protein ABT340_15600 [Streptosporangium sp. NPDC000239]|uniref:hypothetical protein n=1 Tax=Streptosporangium sp. NPDC000239 TaxID=3154248 RepID=UPI00331CEC91